MKTRTLGCKNMIWSHPAFDTIKPGQITLKNFENIYNIYKIFCKPYSNKPSK